MRSKSLAELWKTVSNAQFARFLAVGVVNTAFGYGLFLLLLFFGISSQQALISSTVAGVIFNYFTTGRLVFRARGTEGVIGFVLVYVVVYAVNAFALWRLTAMGVGAHLAQAMILPATVSLAYVLNKILVFKRYPSDSVRRDKRS